MCDGCIQRPAAESHLAKELSGEIFELPTHTNDTVVLEIGALQRMLRIEFQVQEDRFRTILQEHLGSMSVEIADTVEGQAEKLEVASQKLEVASQELVNDHVKFVSEPKPLTSQDGAEPVAEAASDEEDVDTAIRAAASKATRTSIIDRAADNARMRRVPSLANMSGSLIYLVKFWSQCGKEQEVQLSNIVNKIVMSKAFTNICTIVVVLNAVHLGFTSEYAITHLSQPSTPWISVVDICFAAFYIIELFLRLIVFKTKFFYNSDWRWNWFDTFLVALSFYEEISKIWSKHSAGGNKIAIVRTIRLVKTVKMLRFIHAMNFFRELRHFLVPITQSVRSLFWTMLMLSIILYMFSIIFLQGVADALLDNDFGEETDLLMKHFGSVKDTMTSLYCAITGGNDWSLYADLLKGVGLHYYYFFFFYIAFLTFAVLNILTGIFVDSAMQYSNEDRSSSNDDLEEDTKAKTQLLSELERIEDDDASNGLTPELFERHVRSQPVQTFLNRLEIQSDDALNLLRRLAAAASPQGVDLETFLDCAIYMKGYARSVHLHELMAESTSSKLEILAALRGMEEKLALVKQLQQPKLKPKRPVTPRDMSQI